MDENDSVFNLITSLCEHYLKNTEKTKSTRSRCYEGLLGKRIVVNPKKFKDVKGTTDPLTQLLAWNFRIVHEFDLKECAVRIEELVDKIKVYYKEDEPSFNSILKFLLQLRNLPSKDTDKLDLSSLPLIDNPIDQWQKLFKLPDTLRSESSQYSEDTFSLNLRKRNRRNIKPPDSFEYKIGDISNDECLTPISRDSILEIASNMPYCNTRNWENYGYYDPEKEKPFLSELGDMSSLWVENLDSLYKPRLKPELPSLFNSKMKSRKEFLKDAKYLLVGIPSETFGLNSHKEFKLMPGILIEGITPNTLQSYCKVLVFCGTCYKALKDMGTSEHPNTRRFKYPGYVFTEFCESMNRYLQFYRTAAVTIADSTNFLTFHEKTYQIRMQIATLSSICKVGPFAKHSEEMPHGVALLNYLYQKIMVLTDKNIQMVLYSIFYPCCQVYFSRFLQQWMLEGKLNDPYGEFFIIPQFKYISTRGRTYWTRSYTVRQDIVPDFLVDLSASILMCGKMMNLLNLCAHSSKLYHYLMGTRSLIISCCLTHDQIVLLEQNTRRYYLEAFMECGAEFNLSQVMERKHENDLHLLNLIAKKRAASLKRIELERLRALQEQKEKRQEALQALREQQEAAMEQKQMRIYAEIQKEIKVIEENLELENIRQKLIEEESKKLIGYYSKLFVSTESRMEQIDKRIKSASSIQIEQHPDKDIFRSTIDIPIDKVSNSSKDSFYTAEPDTEDSPRVMHTSRSLDVLNANVSNPKEKVSEDNLGENNKGDDTTTEATTNTDKTIYDENIQRAIHNFDLARKIKHKVMTEELGLRFDVLPESSVANKTLITNLTQAQKNKLKVLSSEFGIEIKPPDRIEKILTIAEINRNKNMKSNECFHGNYDKKLDNENFVNKNVNNTETNVNIKKSKSLILNINNKPTVESEKPIPMSVDSTPMSDFPISGLTTPSTTFLSLDTKLDSIPNTGDTQQSSEPFSFHNPSKKNSATLIPIYFNQKANDSNVRSNKLVFSKRVSIQEALAISKNSSKVFLHESVAIPLRAQLKLGNSEVLRYFFNDLQYLKHLESLRSYFFLQDGEFARNITENLFEKLYEANFPLDLINCRTLQNLTFDAFENSSRYQENAQLLSFKINSLPKCFDLGHPDVLDCLSLTYKVQWPLNILLPTDTIGKYDQVFKFLINLNRISWVLKRIFLELKIFAKETGKKEIYLMSSPHYRRLHQCRHVMTHFMQILQGYIVGDVLQTSWEFFKKSLSYSMSLDDVYIAHTAYLKNIIFMCMLNQKSVALRNVLEKIFIVILKFYDYMRSRSWQCEDGIYIHPNFEKLDKIFRNFEDLVMYLFKLGRKVVKSGYQPNLLQFLDTLNVNEYYSKHHV